MGATLSYQIAFVVSTAASVFMATPALAYMPNPQTLEYKDHTKSLDMGVDAEPQHFAYANVLPQGRGKYQITVRCENGSAGTVNNAIFQVLFRNKDRTLFAYTHQCGLDRDFLQRSGQAISITPGIVDLSGTIRRVDNVRFKATLAGGSSGTKLPKIPGLPDLPRLPF